MKMNKVDVHPPLKRENNFDFIRLFAAFCVMVYHAVHHMDLQFLWVTKGSDFWFKDGVETFFIMSGMLVYYSYQRSVEKGRPISHYYINRFLRVAPAIYVYAIVITIILVVINAIDFSEIMSLGFIAWAISHIALIPVYHPDLFSEIGIGVLNGSLWTIPVEFSFYLVVPLIFILHRKIGFKLMISILLIIWLGSYFIVDLENSQSIIQKLFNVTFIPYLLYFALGIVWGKYWSKAPQQGYIAIAALIIFITLRFELITLGNDLIVTLLCAITLSYLVLWFGNKGPLIFNRVTKVFGDLSFGAYIWHMVVVNLFIYFDIQSQLSGLNSNIILLMVFSITFICAFLSWHLVEKQALKFKPYNSRNEINKELAKQSITEENMVSQKTSQ